MVSGRHLLSRAWFSGKPCVVVNIHLGETLRRLSYRRGQEDESSSSFTNRKPTAFELDPARDAWHDEMNAIRQVVQQSKERTQQLRQQPPPASPVDQLLSAANNSDGTSSGAFKAGNAVLFSYSDVMKRVTSRKQFRRRGKDRITEEMAEPLIEYLLREEPIVPVELPALREALNNDSPYVGESLDLVKQFVSDVSEQQNRFLEATGWSHEQRKAIEGGLFYATTTCAKNALGAPAEMIWLKCKEAGCMDKQLLQTLLHVAATFSPGNRRKRALYAQYLGNATMDILDTATLKGEANQHEELTDIVDEIAICHDLKYQPTEQSLMYRSRLLIAHGQGKLAEDLLNRYSADVVLHLRSYLPLLRLYLQQGDARSALRVYKKMRELSRVNLDEDTYVTLIAELAALGVYNPKESSLESFADIGVNSVSGPALLNELLGEMREEILEIPSALTRRLYNAFVEGFPESGLQMLSWLGPLKVNHAIIREDETLVADLVQIDPYSGYCKRSGITLPLLSLSDSQIEKMKETMLKLANERNAKLQEKIASRRNDSPSFNQISGADRLESFYRWLNRREGDPYTVIVDGANVGYHMQNFETGRFNWHQLKFVVDELEKVGENVLVVLPRKYTFDVFTVSVGPASDIGSREQRLTSAEKRIRTEMMDSNKLAVVPPGFLDDYYWILASVSEQRKSRQGRDLSVPVDDPSGRWPGTRPVLLTNDKMRDHRLGMMEPMLFRRWYSNYIVNYNFLAFEGSEASRTEIGFSQADFFSREIQCNKAADGSDIWHIPVSDQEDVWFCLSIRGKGEQGVETISD